MAHKLTVAHDGSRLNPLQWGKINKFCAIVNFRQEALRKPKCTQLPSLQLPNKKEIFKMPAPCGDEKCKDKSTGECKCGSGCKCDTCETPEKCNCKSGGQCSCKQGSCQC